MRDDLQRNQHKKLEKQKQVNIINMKQIYDTQNMRQKTRREPIPNEM